MKADVSVAILGVRGLDSSASSPSIILTLNNEQKSTAIVKPNDAKLNADVLTGANPNFASVNTQN